MIKQITINNVFEAALQIEATGENFYRKYAEKSESTDIKRTFDFLAFKEQRHALKFKEMLEMLRLEEAQKGISKENQDRISKMIKDEIFSEEKSPDFLLKNVKNMRDALEAALALENDSIRFYTMMKSEINPAIQKEVEKIITEENAHAQTISGMLENIP